MTDATTSFEQLEEVVRLSTLLSEQVLDALIMKRGFEPEQAVALAKAARLLQDHGVEWPPLLLQVIQELASKEEPETTPQAEPSRQLADIISGGLSRLLSKARPRTNE